MTDPYTNAPVNIEGETYIVLALAGWTNQVVREEHGVPIDGIPVLAQQMLFEAWDAGEAQPYTIEYKGLQFEDWKEQHGPQDCSVVAVPANWRELELADARKRAEEEATRMQDDDARLNIDWSPRQFEQTVERLIASRLAYRTHSWRGTRPETGWMRHHKRTKRSEFGRMLRWGRVVDSYRAEPSASPSPVFAQDAVDPIAPPPHQVLGPYSD